MFGRDYLDKTGDPVGGLVVQEKHVLNYWLEYRINLGVQLFSMLLHQLKFVSKTDNRVNSLV